MGGAAGLRVNIDHDAADDRCAVGDFEAVGHMCQEFLDAVMGFHAQNRILRPNHANIGQVTRSARQNSLICGLYVRVRPNDDTGTSIEIVSEGGLFGCRFGMEIKE